MKEPVDFHHLLTRHDQINLRLEEWARWVRVSPQRWMVQPMFRFARSNSRQWHQPELKAPVNTLAAHEIERAVYFLPENHRTAIRWFYVFPFIHPGAIARRTGTTVQGVRQLIDDGRDMLINRLKNKLREPVDNHQ